MFSEKDMKKMFLEGMAWERRNIQPISTGEAIEISMRNIRTAQQKDALDLTGVCPNCDRDWRFHDPSVCSVQPVKPVI